MELTDLANQISEMEMNWIRTLYIILISRLDLSVSVCVFQTIRSIAIWNFFG
jgi:hypothetical protein